MRTFGDEPRNFEPWSSNENDTELAPVAQQPMRARAYCAHPSIRDHWALRSNTKDIFVFVYTSDSQSGLYRPLGVYDNLQGVHISE
ncbi:hypothetical protein TNCV_4461951 [Trichonephila clavipes]|nr:hypothetical protein TNCV_4461951 [Trichonephila clavipes]